MICHVSSDSEFCCPSDDLSIDRIRLRDYVGAYYEYYESFIVAQQTLDTVWPCPFFALTFLCIIISFLLSLAFPLLINSFIHKIAVSMWFCMQFFFRVLFRRYLSVCSPICSYVCLRVYARRNVDNRLCIAWQYINDLSSVSSLPFCDVAKLRRLIH